MGVLFTPIFKKEVFFIKRIDLGKQYALFTSIPGIANAAGEIQEDVRSGGMYCELAHDLINEIESLCKVPFTVEICEYRCGEGEPHTYAKICKLNARGHEMVYPAKNKPVFCLKAEQFYAARNYNDAHENYMGRLVVKVQMFLKKADASPTDAGSQFIVNLQADPILRVACAHYYEKIFKYFGEWTTDYINAPNITVVRN